MRYHFAPFTLDVTRGLLQVAGRDIAIEPRGFALLVLLVTHHDRMVTKDEIVEAVWDGRIVSDAAIATVIKTTRKAVGDDGVAQKLIRTVRGRGCGLSAHLRQVSLARFANLKPRQGQPRYRQSHRAPQLPSCLLRWSDIPTHSAQSPMPSPQN